MNLHLLPSLLGLTLTLLCGLSRTAAQAPPPDILLIMPDQWRGDCLSILGNPAVSTPNLDALAARGALFGRAYATVPSCIAARHALLTGLFPQTSGIVGFASRPIRVPTLPRQLADAGYTTALVGRNMHQVPADAPYGYQHITSGSTYTNDDDYDRWLRTQAPETGGIRALIERTKLSLNGWEAAPWPLAAAMHPTAWIVQQSLRTIADTPADRPLFLTASFYAPHPPLFPPQPWFDAALARELPPPAHGDWVHWSELRAEGNEGLDRVLLTGETLATARAGYHGLCDHLDHEIGPLVTAFQHRSEAAGRPWLVVFVTDHGEMLGDHGYFRKCEPYQGSANIPFVIAGSESLGFVRGLRSPQPVCLEDLLPTLLELAGKEPEEEVDGISLVPVLRGDREHVRDWLHFEHADCYSREQAFHSLTDGRFKYVWRPLDGSEQLFDLDADPREEHDLAAAQPHVVTLTKWRSLLIERLADRPEGFSDGKQLRPGRSYPALPPRRRSR